MTTTSRFCILILWLASTSAAAAPLGSREKDHSPEMVPLMTPAENTPKALNLQTGADESEDTIMRRLRVIVDELKRKGPPPVGCMEG